MQIAPWDGVVGGGHGAGGGSPESLTRTGGVGTSAFAIALVGWNPIAIQANALAQPAKAGSAGMAGGSLGAVPDRAGFESSAQLAESIGPQVDPGFLPGGPGLGGLEVVFGQGQLQGTRCLVQVEGRSVRCRLRSPGAALRDRLSRLRSGLADGLARSGLDLEQLEVSE